MLQVPGVAHRRVHVAHVDLVGTGQHAFRDRVVAGDDEVVAAQVELLDGERHQAEIVAEEPAREGKALDEARPDLAPAEEAALTLGHEVGDGEEVSLGKADQDLLEHALGARVGLEPLVHDGDAARRAARGTAIRPARAGEMLRADIDAVRDRLAEREDAPVSGRRDTSGTHIPSSRHLQVPVDRKA